MTTKFDNKHIEIEAKEFDYNNDIFKELKQQTSYTPLFKFAGFDCSGYGCEFEGCILNVEHNHRYRYKTYPKLTIRENKNNPKEIILICKDFET